MEAALCSELVRNYGAADEAARCSSRVGGPDITSQVVLGGMPTVGSATGSLAGARGNVGAVGIVSSRNRVVIAVQLEAILPARIRSVFALKPDLSFGWRSAGHVCLGAALKAACQSQVLDGELAILRPVGLPC